MQLPDGALVWSKMRYFLHCLLLPNKRVQADVLMM
jgi:hypothetical protein